jgi:tetratricopeptide (TPR) repeat protein
MINTPAGEQHPSTGVLSTITQARQAFFRDKNPMTAHEAISPLLAGRRQLSPMERMMTIELGALILRALKQYREAQQLYLEGGDDYQAGYCEMLQGNLSSIKSHWGRVINQRHNHWCLVLFGMVTRQLNSYPTMLQIRNHIECDIANLIDAGQHQLVENVLCYGEFLVQFNMEAYKFLGRALMHAGWLDHCEPLLLKSQKTLPNDPEIYYHLGQYHTLRSQPEKARLMLNQCLLITPTYTPARDLLQQLPA